PTPDARRTLYAAALGLVAAALFVNVDWYPTASPATRALDHWCAGNGYMELGHLPEAEAQYRKALALDPSNADTWMNLGAAQYGAGRVSDAAGSFRHSIRLAGADSRGYLNLAKCELASGRSDGARRLLEQAVRLDPEDVAAKVDLARL